jgi:hypothetical protein
MKKLRESDREDTAISVSVLIEAIVDYNVFAAHEPKYFPGRCKEPSCQFELQLF